MLDFLSVRAASGLYPFHMPGHKGNARFFRGIDLKSMDITEVRGADNLRCPGGIIRVLEDRLAQAYGACRSLVCVNGSSAGLLAAMLYTAGDGRKVALARNSHISAFSGLALSGAEAVLLAPQVTPYGFAGGVTAEDVAAVLAAYPEVRGVFVVSPTYEGLCCDIAGIAGVTRGRGVLLVVDEAHGAHFGLHPAFPASAVSCADIVVQSLHKTMPALNQSAVVHVGRNVDAERLKMCLNMVQTTSPSYVAMAMMERCADIAADPANFEAYAAALAELRARLGGLRNIGLAGRELCGSFGVADADGGKLVFVANRGKGRDIYTRLLEGYALELEMYGPAHAVAMTSLADTPEGFARLADAVCRLDTELEAHAPARPPVYRPPARFSVPAMSARRAMLRPSRGCKLDDAAGRVCAAPVTPYPPGIPLLVPGEIIDESAAHHLKSLAFDDIMIDGISEGMIKVVDGDNLTDLFRN
ncbi:MAG: aminotransferase class I/II-fold pyridoxal phosphate-dependent enzyme [Defluviitaleaceae bacterium]|nr:aminotransferase class I/II-fold pyridoxal phosphate-dependent enzyme [Defluviitaleaceae bacterium]